MNKRTLHKTVKKYIASNNTQEAVNEFISYAEKHQLKRVSSELIIINARYAKYTEECIKGVISNESSSVELNKINDSILLLLDSEELKMETNDANIKSDEVIAWQFHKDHNWIPIDISEQYILRDNFSEHASKLTKDLDRSGEINFLGLPQVGRSTYLMQLLKSVSGLQGKTVLFIPNQNFSIKDYLDIIRTEKYKDTVGKNHIIGLDDFEISDDKKNLFPNAALCVIPDKLSNPYSSQFITPFNFNETNKLIKQEARLELNSIVFKTIIRYSSGFPLLAIILLNFFEEHKNLSIELILKDKYIVGLLDKIYESFLAQVDDDLWKLWVGLVAVGKTLKRFEQSINNRINTSEFALLKQMGFDRVISSPLLLEFFRLRIGESQINLFKKELVKSFINQHFNNSIGIWTPNDELKFFSKGSSVSDVAKYIFKSDILINRIDWEKSKIDERPISSFEEKLEFGNVVSFALGKRNEIKQRSKEYKRLNREFKKLIFLGDSEARKGNLEKAEKYYLSTSELKYNIGNNFIPDSNYGKVRLANLYRVQGRIDESEKVCLPIIRSTPNPFAYLCVCICKFWKGDFLEAKKHVEKALELNPCYINALLWKARVLSHIEDFEGANSTLKEIKVKELEENSHFIYLLLSYGVAKNRVSNSIHGKPSSWRIKIMHFISKNGRNVSKQIIPLVLAYLEKLPQKEREFRELEKFYLSNHIHSKGIDIDIFWWKELISHRGGTG